MSVTCNTCYIKNIANELVLNSSCCLRRYAMKENEWIVLNYTLPKEPSRTRVSVWRKLKKMGSVSIGQSMWLLPQTQEHIEFFKELSGEIIQNNGDSYILNAEFICNKSKEDIMELFNKAREEEYREVLEKCEDFFREIEKEIKRKNFTFAEIEENEYEYKKLMEWHRDIGKRDFFQASLKIVSEQELVKCRQELEDFSKKVYELNGEMS